MSKQLSDRLLQYGNLVFRINSEDKIQNPLLLIHSSIDSLSSGTGFFIDKEGHGITCYHVIKNSVENGLTINISNYGEKIFNASVLSILPDDDIAIILVDISDVKSDFESIFNSFNFPIGDANDIKIGNIVNAYGYPLGSRSFVKTDGQISSWRGSKFQITAAINSGNSGGPIIKIDGNEYTIIGIAVEKMVGEGAEGMGFATQINNFTCVKELYKSNPIILKSKLFTQFSFLSEQHIKYLCHEFNNQINLNTNGLVVDFINPISPLYTKINIGDILIKWDGYDIEPKGQINYNGRFMNFEEIFKIYCDEKNVQFEFFNSKTGKIYTDNIKIYYRPNPITSSSSNIEKIRPIYYPFEKLKEEGFYFYTRICFITIKIRSF